MRQPTGLISYRHALSQFLTPPLWKQAHQAWHPKHPPARWALRPLAWVLLTLAWTCGDSQDERCATARAAYVACHQKERRPGATLAGFLQALARLPMPVLRALARGVRDRLGERFLPALRLRGLAPLAGDGTRLACPRSGELQRRLGAAGKPDSAPMVYLTTWVLLPLGLLWSWRLGKGTASAHDHLRQLLPTLPAQPLVVADAFYLGYDLFAALGQAGAAFLVRLSSRAYLDTERAVPWARFREGPVYYWPEPARGAGRPPLRCRRLRVRGRKADVWLLTDVLNRQRLSHRSAKQVYRWRWRNAGLFRVYQRLLAKGKLSGRTVALVHREAEGSLLALPLLRALAAQAAERGHAAVVLVDSPRRTLRRRRGALAAARRSLGPRQFAQYRRLLEQVRCQERPRVSGRVRQEWPRRKEQKPPKPPKLRVMDDAFKAKVKKALQAAQAANR